MNIFIAFLYLLCATALFVYGMNCYILLWYFLRSQKKERSHIRNLIEKGQTCFDTPETLPVVTTQIPLYNEANVAERVIRACAAIDYPKDKHEVQILDDSSDETITIVDQVVSELRSQGTWIHVIRREKRTGYKAGALQEGMDACKGEFIAIFDSDFVPNKDYLKQMVPFLMSDTTLGFVQARWGHLNPKHSLLTRAQTIGIDGHFIIEQSARAYNKLFMNFNGTAGLWRKEAIYEAGGWQSDTLTEDLDLSYRCQLAGRRACYAPDVVVPAELPESYAAFKSQQFRWAKGSIQTAIKLLPRVIRSDASRMAKFQACIHMTHYSIHPFMAMLALLALPVLYFLNISAPTAITSIAGFGISIAMFGPSMMYVFSQCSSLGKGWRQLIYLPALMCVGVGIALSNTRAVAEALIGIKSGFIRTPKSGAQTVKRYRIGTSLLPLLEIVFGIYATVSLLAYLKADKLMIGPFLLMYAGGFLLVGFASFREHLRSANTH